MIPKYQGSLHYSNKEILKLNVQLEKIYKNNEVSITDLIDLCRLYGTLPFAKLASNIAFIGTKIIKSLAEYKAIKPSRVSTYLSSIKTILSEMLEDIQKLKDSSFSILEFKAKNMDI